MAEPKKLFQLEDKFQIVFSVPEGVASRDQLVDSIKAHGGRIIEHVGEANFVILSAKVATRERLGLLVTQDHIVLDACWIWESIAQQVLQPWYRYQLGVDEVEIPDKERDINELAFGLARYTPLLGVRDVYLHLAKQFPHRSSRLFGSLHQENRQLVDARARDMANQIATCRPRRVFTAATPVIDTRPGEGRENTDRSSEPVDSVIGGDNPRPVPVPMDNEGISHPVAEPSFSSTFRPGASEEIQFPQRQSTPSAVNEPLAASVSGRSHSKRSGGTGKFVSPTGISIAARSSTSHHRPIKRGDLNTQGREGNSTQPGPSQMGKSIGKGRAATVVSLNQASNVLQFTSVTPPPDSGIQGPASPDQKTLPPILTGPRQLLAISEVPWRTPLPGIRGKDNLKSRNLPEWLNEAYCRKPRRPLSNEDLPASPTDIEAMARYLLSHDQGFLDEFYVDYRDGYKYEHWGGWYQAHEKAIIKAGIDLLKRSEFTWNQERQNIRYHPIPNHLEPTWSEELTLNLTRFEEELLAAEWNPVKDLEHVSDQSFCDDFAERANSFLESQSTSRVGHAMRPRWAFRWAKRGPGSEGIKKRDARQWEHRFQKADRVGELTGVEVVECEYFSSNEEGGCYCGDIHPPDAI